MAFINTGETIYEMIYSVDTSNNPVSGATFSIDVYRDGAAYTGTSVSISLEDADTGAFASSWSTSTNGDYQIYYKNQSTSVIYVTDIYQIRAGGSGAVKVFVGI